MQISLYFRRIVGCSLALSLLILGGLANHAQAHREPGVLVGEGSFLGLDGIEPNGVAVTRDGSAIYVSAGRQHKPGHSVYRIRKSTAAENARDEKKGVRYIAEPFVNVDGSEGKALGSAPADTKLSIPSGLTLSPDERWLYIADVHNHRVLRARTDGSSIEHVAGTGKQKRAPLGSTPQLTNLKRPTDISIPQDGRSIFVIDSDGARVLEINTERNAISELTFNGGGGRTYALVATADALYRLDQHGNLHRSRRDGTQSTQIDLGNRPRAYSLAISQEDRTLMVGHHTGAVTSIGLDDNVMGPLLAPRGSLTEFEYLLHMAVGSDGSALLITDSYQLLLVTPNDPFQTKLEELKIKAYWGCEQERSAAESELRVLSLPAANTTRQVCRALNSDRPRLLSPAAQLQFPGVDVDISRLIIDWTNVANAPGVVHAQGFRQLRAHQIVTTLPSSREKYTAVGDKLRRGLNELTSLTSMETEPAESPYPTFLEIAQTLCGQFAAALHASPWKAAKYAKSEWLVDRFDELKRYIVNALQLSQVGCTGEKLAEWRQALQREARTLLTKDWITARTESIKTSSSKIDFIARIVKLHALHRRVDGHLNNASERSDQELVAQIKLVKRWLIEERDYAFHLEKHSPSGLQDHDRRVTDLVTKFEDISVRNTWRSWMPVAQVNVARAIGDEVLTQNLEAIRQEVERRTGDWPILTLAADKELRVRLFPFQAELNRKQLVSKQSLAMRHGLLKATADFTAVSALATGKEWVSRYRKASAALFRELAVRVDLRDHDLSNKLRELAESYEEEYSSQASSMKTYETVETEFAALIARIESLLDDNITELPQARRDAVDGSEPATKRPATDGTEAAAAPPEAEIDLDNEADAPEAPNKRGAVEGFDGNPHWEHGG